MNKPTEVIKNKRVELFKIYRSPNKAKATAISLFIIKDNGRFDIDMFFDIYHDADWKDRLGLTKPEKNDTVKKDSKGSKIFKAEAR